MKRLIATFKDRLINLPLIAKITISILIVCIVPIIAIFLVYTVEVQNNQTEKINNLAKEELKKSSISIGYNYNSVDYIIDLVRGNSDLGAFLSREDDVPSKDVLDFKRTTVKILESFVTAQPNISSLRVYFDNENIPEMWSILYRKDRHKDEYWANNLGEKNKNILIDEYNIIEADVQPPSNKSIVFLNKMSSQFSSEYTILEITYDMSKFFGDFYTVTDDTLNGFYHNGNIYYQDQDLPSKWQGVPQKLLGEIDTFLTENKQIIDIDGREYFLNYENGFLPDSYYIRLDDVSQLRSKFKEDFISISVVIALSLILLYFTIRMIVSSNIKRINIINENMEKVEDGDFTVNIHDNHVDELGSLAQHFNSMVRRVDELIKQNQKRMELEKASETKALQNQINSHFIYNVLENIKMMAEINYELDISNALTSLAQLLRYSMKWTTQFVTIGQEINHINNYLALLNIRYDYIIQLSELIDGDLKKCLIPKMTLQPIVENAIVHGIEKLAENATVLIRVYKDDLNDIHIEVTDIGTGIPQEKLEHLNKALKGIDGYEIIPSGNGIGLKNVADRIALYYGKDYGVEILSKENCYTKVKVTVPFKTE